MNDFITSQPPLLAAILCGFGIGEVVGQAIYWIGSIATHKWIARTRRKRWGIPKMYDPEEHAHVKPVTPRHYSGDWQCKCGMNLGPRNKSFNQRFRAHVNSVKAAKNDDDNDKEKARLAA